MKESRTGILLLAAGYSRRFSGDKRRAQFPSGSSLLFTTLDRLHGAGFPMRVCLRDEPDDRKWAASFPEFAELLFCDRSHLGMGATLAQGVLCCEDWDVTLVALADMPRISPATIRALVSAAGRERVVVPCHEGKRGHPVAFGRHFYPALKQLAGDRGARDIVERHPERRLLLPVSDPGILFDIDTRQAFESSIP